MNREVKEEKEGRDGVNFECEMLEVMLSLYISFVKPSEYSVQVWSSNYRKSIELLERV